LEQIKTPESSLTLRRRRLLLVIAKAISINCYSLACNKLAVLVMSVMMLAATTNIKAQTNINIGGTIPPGTGYTFANDVLTITANGTYEITGTVSTANNNAARRIAVNSGLNNVNIILNGASITSTGGSALHIPVGSTVNLVIIGENRLISTAAGRAGIYVPAATAPATNHATLTIRGGCPYCLPDPVLKVPVCPNPQPDPPVNCFCMEERRECTTNSNPCILIVGGGGGLTGGAGIGGNGSSTGETRNSGNITINSGNIRATGGGNTGNGNNTGGGGAGIGGGGGTGDAGGTASGNVIGDIIINGGEVVAQGGNVTNQNCGAAAGIGGGGGGGTGGHVIGKIVINEGNIRSNGGGTSGNNSGGGAGIGGGAGGNGQAGGANNSTIEINCGSITAYGGNSSGNSGGGGGAGIGGGGTGGGTGGGGGEIEIDPDADVIAVGGGSPPAAGIGGGGVTPPGAIQITSNPSNLELMQGNTADLSITARVTGNNLTLTFTWYYTRDPYNSTNIIGLTPVATQVSPSISTGTNATQILQIPTINEAPLALGEHYYFCRIESTNPSAPNNILDTRFSRVVQVEVVSCGIEIETGPIYRLPNFIAENQ